MLEESEVLETHINPEGEAPNASALSEEELAELKRRAEVSSQNYERAKKAEAEKKALQEKLSTLEAQLDPMGFVPDDATKKIAELDAKLSRLEEERHLQTVFAQYPALADKRQEFDEYRAQYPVEKLPQVAKLFLSEHDLIETPQRKGLEKAGGGKRSAPSSGSMTATDVERLRKNNYKEYMKLLRSGKLNIG